QEKKPHHRPSRRKHSPTWLHHAILPPFSVRSALIRHCEPTDRRQAPPEDRLREAIWGAELGRSSLLRRYAPRNDSIRVIPLFIQPDVFEAPAIVDAVDHYRQALDPGLPAGAAGRVEDDRADRGFRQHPFELPDDLLALFRIGLHRLLVDKFIELGITISCIIARRAADEILIEHLIRVID